jgi:hypothetical protein
MLREEILARMACSRNPAFEIDLYSLAELLATRLEYLSHKISRQELFQLIAIGAVIYRYRSDELRKESQSKNLSSSRDAIRVRTKRLAKTAFHWKPDEEVNTGLHYPRQMQCLKISKKEGIDKSLYPPL